MNAQRIVTLAMVFLAISPLLAQKSKSRLPETLTVSSVDLRIGMSKDKVLSLLAQNGFEIVAPDEGAKKGTIESFMFVNESHKIAVEIMFENGRLVRASRPVNFHTADEALEAMYGLIAKFQESRHDICHLDAKTKADGDVTIKIATMNCMSRFIEITVMRNNAGEVRLMGVSEGISDSLM